MTRAVGIDVSKHQVLFNPDNAVKPIDFIIQRASWAGMKDEKFDLIHQGVSQFPYRGAYHYYSSGVNWKRQADLFLSVVSGKSFKVLVLDYEHDYNKLTERTADEAWMILEYWKSRFPNKKIILYAGSYTLRDFLSPYGDWSMWDFWIAQYPWYPRPQVGQPSWATGSKRPWKMWQYSKTGNGKSYGCASTFVDLVVFDGTVDEMRDYFKKAVGPPPPPQDCKKEQKEVLSKVMDFTQNLSDSLI